MLVSHWFVARLTEDQMQMKDNLILDRSGALFALYPNCRESSGIPKLGQQVLGAVASRRWLERSLIYYKPRCLVYPIHTPWKLSEMLCSTLSYRSPPPMQCVQNTIVRQSGRSDMLPLCTIEAGDLFTVKNTWWFQASPKRKLQKTRPMLDHAKKSIMCKNGPGTKGLTACFLAVTVKETASRPTHTYC
jgi:hypothetical protein